MEPSKKWYKLDNAAKIIPSTARGANTRVFRISAQLNAPVDPVLLQEALDLAAEEFPVMNCILKKGFFWYYLEENHDRVMVTHDDLPACAPLYLPGRRTPLYRVVWHERRISLEMFHVLADGTGGYMFFKKLLTAYLEMKYALQTDPALQTASHEEKASDAFAHYYEQGRGLKQLQEMASGRAWQITGDPDPEMYPHLIEGIISESAFKALAVRYDTTVGVLATAIYILSITECMSVRERRTQKVVVSVPVNLRRYYESDTARNFFGVINVTFDPAHSDCSLPAIIQETARAFDAQLQAERIAGTMNAYSAIERNVAVSLIPLFIKDAVIMLADHFAKRGVTGTISNLGRIDLPPEIGDHVEYFSAFMAAPNQQICISSFKGRMVFGEASPFVTHKVMLHFFRHLTKMGIPVSLSSNDYDEPEPHESRKPLDSRRPRESRRPHKSKKER